MIVWHEWVPNLVGVEGFEGGALELGAVLERAQSILDEFALHI